MWNSPIFGKNPSATDIKKMISVIGHRGPDHQGFYSDNFVQLGSCRLSIFDLLIKETCLWKINQKILYYL